MPWYTAVGRVGEWALHWQQQQQKGQLFVLAFVVVVCARRMQLLRIFSEMAERNRYVSVVVLLL